MIKAGTAKIIINNEIGTDIQGASHKKKVITIRDDLEANALWLSNDQEGLLFISCDLGGLELDFVQKILPDIANVCGIAKDKIIIGCTHTHSGPSVLGPTHPDKSLDLKYLDNLKNWFCEISAKAVESAEQVNIAIEKGVAEIGYNRRVCYEDGSHAMHGNPARPDFTGLEGPNDPQHTVLFIRNMENKLKAILYNNTAHTITFYGEDFLSADYPGLTRQYFREIFGDISVLFFNGAIGDISHVDEIAKSHVKESREQKMIRVAHLLSGETLRLLQHAAFRDDVTFKHMLYQHDMKLRKLPEERLEWARRRLAQYKKDRNDNLEAATAHMNILFHERFGDKEYETIDIHAACIDDFAFITVPCEIFCYFGLRIKERSPFPITALFGLVNGDMGYCPTTEGLMGGHWEGTTSLTSRWEEKAGYIIVEQAARLLNLLNRSKKTAP